MATRLDRLFLLLDTGSTPLIRRSAAEQLGEVQKLHPHELNNLLAKVQGFLASPSWDTRIAAAQAVEAIAKNVPQWKPAGAVKEEAGTGSGYVNGRLSFQYFNIQRVLIQGASLLASEGDEYDIAEENMYLDQREHLARQRQQLNKRLGLDAAGGMGVKSEDLFKEEDLVLQVSSAPSDAGAEQRSSVADLVRQQTNECAMSSREKNRAKRRVKQLSRQLSKDTTNGDGSDTEHACKRRKTDVIMDQPSSDSKVVMDSVLESTTNMEELSEWPFESFSETMLGNLFNPTWEKRHGAATGLREIIRLHGDSAGKTTDMPANRMYTENQQWLEDIALRLICVLALDRFGDFVADEVVAPVRESCAQTLGVTLHHMYSTGVTMVAMVLLQLLQQPHWEVRHGGLLGLKYLLAVRQDLARSVLPNVLGCVFLGLQDHDDDVRAVAASALLPVADTLIIDMSAQVPAIVACLWHTLLDLDDLTASTNSVMTLLSTILSHPQVPPDSISPAALSELVPRLWPFLRHNSVSVRRAALQALHTLVAQNESNKQVEWLVPLLPDALRHVYQRALIEDKNALRDMIVKVWRGLLSVVSREHLTLASSPWLGVWLCLAMQSSSLPFDPELLIEAKHQPKEQTPSRLRHAELQASAQTQQHNEYIGGYLTVSKVPGERDAAIVQARCTVAKLLGLLFTELSGPLQTSIEGLEPAEASLLRLLTFHLATKSGLQRLITGLVVHHWAQAQKPCLCPDGVVAKLQECLVETIYFDEIASSFTRMQADCRNFLTNVFKEGIAVPDGIVLGSVLTLDQAQQLTTAVLTSEKKKPAQKEVVKVLQDQQVTLRTSVMATTNEQMTLCSRVQSSLAGGLVWMNRLTEKLNPMIRPLMEALKKEQNFQMQSLAAGTLSQLLLLCVTREPCPNPKVIRNLCAALCCDPGYTPLIRGTADHHTANADGQNPSKEVTFCDIFSGIIMLYTQQKAVDRPLRRGPAARKAPVQIDASLENLLEEEDEAKRQLLVQRRGAMLTLKTIAEITGSELSTQMKSLWETMTFVKKYKDASLPQKDEEAAAQELVNALQVLEIVGPSTHTGLVSELLELVPCLLQCVQSHFTAVRHLTARCLAMLGKLNTATVMNAVLDCCLSLLGDTDSITHRQGAAETLNCITDQLGVAMVPYIVLLVVPLMGSMSDQDEAVRLTATQCFGSLIRLMPLEAGLPDPPCMSAVLAERRQEQRGFLEQLMDPSKVQNYQIPIPVDAELRQYQQDGVNWLSFLNKYKMHGILCDDMGLGKTLQSICILAGDHHTRAQQYKVSKSADCAPLPSLVVCPPTLTGHWVYEVEKFVDLDYLNPLHYTGVPAERTRLQSHVKKHNLVVASYEVVRNDIDFFGKLSWNYVILDEGHVIKNSKTKLSRAVKQLTCNHRLILSGTPIQNNVLELWSLFDFLMPGFLGTERQFQARYGRPILQSRDAKSSSREQEAGALAMESLHRQTLPFLLRRMKEDVLKDLPPKIIQDYYCDLSRLQIQLYEDFSRSHAKQNVEESLVKEEEEKKGRGSAHIFQALQYLRKLVNHPALVLKPDHPKYDEVKAQLRVQNSDIRDLQHAPKLTALKQLLLDCGLSQADSDSQPVVNQHRVLLFCQLKSMLDIVEQDLLKVQMPSVTYLRLDGSIPAGSRHALVNRFNTDPSIDVLLLTTHVGGLGLNLTGADTVIFVEHDWNPMKDLQAMDRAHRIGQKKVVNVYRLITRGTLEEKIMGLQKFKINIANTVISQENASLASMGTDQLLDLFSLAAKKPENRGETSESQAENKNQSLKSVLEGVDELWDEKLYEKEYDLSNFMKTLRA